MKSVIANIGIFLAFCAISFVMGASLVGDRLQKEAIQRGYAQHNPTTGNFEWKENK